MKPRLAILFCLALVLVAFFCVIFQSRGQAFTPRRPFILQSAGTSGGFNPTNLPELYYWWVASDLPDGNVLTWTDRIHQVVLSNTTVGKRPVKSSNYITFTSSTYSLSNALPASAGVFIKSFFWIGEFPGPYGSDGFIFAHNGSIRSGWCYEGTRTLVYDSAPPFYIDKITNGVLHDNNLFQSTILNTFVLYTNAILNLSNNIGGGINWPDYIGIGNDTSQSYPLVGKLREVMIFTNKTPTLTTISNLHWYGTNTYGGTNNPAYTP